MDTKQHAWGTYSAKVDKEKKVKIREIYVKPYDDGVYLNYSTIKGDEKWDIINGSALVESEFSTFEIKKGGYVIFNSEILHKIKAGPSGLTLREVKGY
jgi:hypothetical protein